MNIEYLECSCYSDEHRLVMSYDEEYNEIHISFFLRHYTFFRRIWIAIKYIFGYKCKYGHWDCFLLNPKDKNRFIEILNKIRTTDQS